MDKTFEGWDKQEWDRWLVKLGDLSLVQLQQLSDSVDISFGDRKPETKQAYLLVLDEADPKLLEQQYTRVIASSDEAHE